MDRYEAERWSYVALANRFWDRVDQSAGPDACWPWMLGCNLNGYGNFQFRHGGAHLTFHASRWALGFSMGEPLRWDSDVHEEACHHCDNPPCCNPAHLYVGDRHSNIADAWRRGHFRGRLNANALKTECLRGHPLAGENVRVTPQGKRECRACDAHRARERRRRLRSAA